MSKDLSPSSSLFLARIVVLLGFLAATGVSQAVSRSKDHHNRTDRRHRGRSSTPTPYLTCPVVICPEIPADCKTVEYIVMEFDDPRSGQVISCQSCSYCLDLPSLPSRSRQRRDLLDLIILDAINTRVTCPAVPGTCLDVRMTRTWMSGQSTAPWSVTHCPACFDRTLTNHRHKHASLRPLSLSN